MSSVSNVNDNIGNILAETSRVAFSRSVFRIKLFKILFVDFVPVSVSFYNYYR